MAVYRFNLTEHPELFQRGAIHFVQETFKFQNNALVIQEEDFQESDPISEVDEDVIETLEIEFLVNRIRIKTEKEEGLGLEGLPVLKIIQQQKMDMLLAPPCQPEIISTTWICEINASLDKRNDFKYEGELTPTPSAPILEEEKKGRWDQLKSWLGELSTTAAPPISPLLWSRHHAATEEQKQVRDLLQAIKAFPSEHRVALAKALVADNIDNELQIVVKNIKLTREDPQTILQLLYKDERLLDKNILQAVGKQLQKGLEASSAPSPRSKL